ncbi:universal stress protein [Nocardioides sp. GXQ0305]|uniref:universal stress protein n=1 Tax=Nocardioides sp. GXQ0305 TaxID=3423912 RepID=UPI003D7CD46D
MTEQNPNPILVAVGHDPMEPALAWAAAEVERLSCGLHLLHVVHLLARGPELSLGDEVHLQQVGRKLLDAALRQARALVAEGVPVTADLAMGAVVPALVEATRGDARMVVVQHRHLSRTRRAITRSVASGVAAHARVPVVAVSSTWSPDGGTTRTVTVGVDVADRSAEVLRTAADAAASRAATLRIVHTWDYPATYDDVLPVDVDSDDWTSRAVSEITRALEPLSEHLDGVPVQIDAGRARAADVLLEASAHSDLLVVGRHDPLVPVGSHLGPVARAVLRESHCPVLLADPHPARWHRRRPPSAAAAAHE